MTGQGEVRRGIAWSGKAGQGRHGMATEKTEKTCGDCQRLLPIEWFAKHSANKDGHQFVCRDCQHDRYRHRKQRGLRPVMRVGL